MNVARASHDAMIMVPSEQVKPTTAKRTVSAASIFKQQSRRMKYCKNTSATYGKAPENSAQVYSMRKPPNAKSASSLCHSDGRVVKRKSNMHPLAAEFKETSKSYRQHLFKAASIRINKTLEVLLNRLHNGILQVASPSKHRSDQSSSPLKLTAPAKYERMALKIYQPLSLYKLNYTTATEEGKRVAYESTLEDRMNSYGEHLAERIEYVTNLQLKWESVVSEIWKLGTTCLGETTMQEILFTAAPAVTVQPSTSSSQHTNAESTLFVPEHGSSPHVHNKPGPSKKHVTFNIPTPLTSFPTFLYQPSRSKKEAVSTAPIVATDDIKTLKTQVKELGEEQITELGVISKDHAEYWKRKTENLAQVLLMGD
ncbi:hypothetical protein ACN47E_004708 [Coniothyrium glycines]